MPAHKHNRHHRTREDEHNNNLLVEQQDNNHHQPQNGAIIGGGQNDNQTPINLVRCCVPSGCGDINEFIDPSDPCDSVKVVCNNENCAVGSWMHRFCFESWEQGVLAYLRSCGRARSWSEKQRLQNLWTKKGYDLAFKACDCKCSRGHLRKDLDYIPPMQNDNANNTKKGRKNKKKNDKPVAVMTSKVGMNPNNHNANNNSHNGSSSNCTSNGAGRPRTSSVSTGSSPPNSYLSCSPSTPVGSPSCTSNLNAPSIRKNSKCDNAVESPSIGQGFQNISAGNNGSLFKRRMDLSAFKNLPRYKQNPYYIKMEEEGCHNDDTRIFVLSNLSSHKMGSLPCVLCKCELPVFDRYPLIDGTLFLSPQSYFPQTGPGKDSSCNNFGFGDHNKQVQVDFDGKLQYLNAVCISCLEGRTDVRCSFCKKRWEGSTLLLGTMYSYDIFAAMPCCPKRLTCKYCRRAVVDVIAGLPYYSEYSHRIECPYCKIKDYHFIRPLHETFFVKNPIWNEKDK